MKRATKIVQCSYCPRKMRRTLDMPRNSCEPCKAKMRTRWAKEHPEVWERANRRWRQANSEHLQAYNRQWRADNPELNKAMQRRAHKKHKAKLKPILAGIIAEIESLCGCGDRHTDEQRQRVLRRILPASAHDIREAWSCIWGSPDENGGGAKRLYRDLESLGAVKSGGEWTLMQKARAA